MSVDTPRWPSRQDDAVMVWSEEQLGSRSSVPDLTRGRWPLMCQVRSALVLNHHEPVKRRYVCTRIAGHTGRHAAGSGGRIVAVWAGGR